MKHKHMYDLCKQHMHSYVLAETNDGQKFDGILTGLDEEYAYFAIPIEQGNMGQIMDYPHQLGMMENMQGYSSHPGMMNEHTQGAYRHDSPEQMQGEQEELRQFGYYGFGYPGYGYFPRRRFSRLVLPLAALVALTALPWY